MKNYKPDSFAEYQDLSDSFIDFDFSSIEIKPSIDYLKFSISFIDLPSRNVSDYLRENGFEITRSYPDGGDATITNIQAQISIGGKWYGLFCKVVPKCFRTTFRMVDPDKVFFNHIFGMMRYPYVLSEVEYSLDFHGCDNGEMFSFLASHGNLKKPGNLFTVDEYDYPPTQYFNNVRDTNQVGCKVYIKEKEALVFVRLEVSIKQRQFRILGIDSLFGATQVTAEDVFRKLQIQAFDFENFLKNLGIRGYEYQDFEQDIMGAMNGKANCGGLTAVKKMAEALKPNPAYYFKTHPFQDAFHNAIKNMTFVPSGTATG